MRKEKDLTQTSHTIPEKLTRKDRKKASALQYTYIEHSRKRIALLCRVH